MSESDGASPARGGETEITLGVLNAVHADSSVTQRSVAQQLGIALGLTNAYLKRCIRKGFIKVSQIPPNRYAYYLTPKGFAEKSRLTAEYLTSSLTFFRRARNQCTELLADAGARGMRRVALYGAGDLAEIATLAAREAGVTIVGIVDPLRPAGRVAGLPTAPALADLGAVDAVMVTDLNDPHGAYERLRLGLPEARILTPPLLGILREPREGGEAS